MGQNNCCLIDFWLIKLIDWLIDLLLLCQGYEGSLLKVTSKNGKTASPVGFVTFNSRAGAEAAKQDLQVSLNKPGFLRRAPAVFGWPDAKTRCLGSLAKPAFWMAA